MLYFSIAAMCGTISLMKSRTNALAALGIPTEFHAYKGLGHGFGLGTGTVAEEWINDAIRFWEQQF